MDAKLKLVIEGVLYELEKGKSFSVAVSQFGRSFDSAFIALVSSAEQTGQLDEVLKAVAKDYEREKKLVSEVKQALTYPSVILCAMMLVAFLMVVMVLPKLGEMYGRMDIEIPMYTRIILDVATFANKNLIWVVLGAVILVVSFILLITKVEKVRLLIKILLSRTPVISNLLTNYDLARFCRSSSLLYANGVPILTSLDISGSIFFKPSFKKAVISVSEQLKKGISIKDSFSQTKVFPGLFTQLIGVGEESASLDQAFMNLSIYFDEKVTESVNRLASIMEPLIMALLGVMVGGMIFSIITPVYQMVGGLV